MTITAADVKKLRDATGAGMMECKAALTEANANCESDFVARTDDFQKLIQDILDAIDKAGDAANDAWLTDPNGPVVALLKPVIGKLGENMAAPRFVRYAGKGYVGQYIHMGGKIGVQVELAGVTPEIGRLDAFAELVKQLAMHI